MAFSWIKSAVHWLRSAFNMDPEHSFWEYMPDIVLIEVLKHLGDRDRLNMALVCKNWYRLLSTPCLWRSRHFDMAGYRAQIIGARACKYAERFGSYLKRLTITCSHPSYHTCKFFQKAMEDMISKLHKAQLQEFEMERLELDRFWKYESPRERLINSFVRFFKTQKSLQYFDMSMGQFPVPGGCRILEAVAHGSGDKVSDMLIEDFFHSRLAAFQVRRYITSISKFTNIKYLALNYNCLSEDIVEIFSKNLAGKLEAVNIKVYRNDPHFHHISGYTWRLLKAACPRLRVAFWLESMGHSSEIIPILVKDIPVWDIHLWTGYDDDAEWHLAQTIDHITDSYGHIIESVSLELDNNHEMVDESLYRLVSRCKTLVSLNINAIILTSTVEIICQMQFENKINLEQLNITCCSLTEVEWVELEYIKEKYKEMIESRGLSFKFSSDMLIDST